MLPTSKIDFDKMVEIMKTNTANVGFSFDKSKFYAHKSLFFNIIAIFVVY